MTKLSDFYNGLKDTFSMDDPRHAKQRRAACRECEIIGSAACISGSAYVVHVTRMGRIMPQPGYFIATILVCLGASLLLSFAPDSEIDQIMKRKQQIEFEKQESEMDVKS